MIVMIKSRIILLSIIISLFFCSQSGFTSVFTKHKANNIDVGVQAIISPVSGYNLNYFELVTVRIFNYGTDDVSNIPVSYRTDDGIIFTDTVKITLNDNDYVDYTFTTRIDLSKNGVYNITAYTLLAGDQDNSNDAANAQIENMSSSYCPSSSIYPLFENIGRVKLSNLDYGSDTPVYNNSLCSNSYSDFTSSLAPVKLIIDSVYIIEVSQIHDFDRFNSCFINVFIDYNNDGVFDYYTERVTGMQTFVDETTVKSSFKVSANAKTGITRMRIIMREGAEASTALPCGTYNWGETEDYSVLIFPYIKYDAGVVNIIVPSSKEGEGNVIFPKVVVRNYGSEDISSMDVSYRLNYSTPVNTKWTGVLKPAKTDTITLSSFTVPVYDNEICIYTTLKGDTNLFNDQLCKSFYGNPKIDVGAFDLISPQHGDCFSASEIVTVRVKNYGSKPIDFSLHNMITTVNIAGIRNVILKDTLKSGILAIDGYVDIIFKTRLDMSEGGDYNFESNAFIDGDGVHSNDAMPQQAFSVYSTITNFPYYENFESFMPGVPGIFDNGWTSGCQSSPLICKYRWQVMMGVIPDTTTGPWTDHTLGTKAGTYIFVQAESAGSPAYAVSPCLDLNQLKNPHLSFWYHMAGKDINNIHIDIYNGSEWISDIFTITGPKQKDKDDLWKQAILDLTAFKGIAKIRFVAERGAGTSGDIAIDDVSVYQPKQTDAGVFAVVNPALPYAKEGTSVPVKVTIKNYGLTPVTSVNVGYKAGNSAPVIETWTGNLAANSTSDYTFTNTLNVISGKYNITVFVRLANDSNKTNDTVKINFTGLLTKPPFLETFESFAAGGSGILKNDWTQKNFANYIWKINSGPTGTAGTGPIADHTLGTANGKYIFTDASNGNNSDIAYLISPLVDLSVFKYPKLSFWYYFYGSDINEMQVQIYSSGKWRNINLLKGQVQTSHRAQWKQMTADLSAYKDIIKLRFTCIRGVGAKGDMAIDDVSIYDSAPSDAAVQSINFPSIFAANALTQQKIEVTIKNTGQQNLKTIYLGYILSDNKPLIEKWNGMLAHDSTMKYTFLTGYSVPAGEYTIKCFIEVLNDTNTTNDTIEKKFIGLARIAVPYTDNFEGKNYFYSDDPIYHWMQGIPGSSFIPSAAPDSKQEDKNLWATNLNGGYKGEAEYALYTPKFDFSNTSGATLSFWHYINFADNPDFGRVMYSTDADTTWVTLGYMGDPNGTNWYNLKKEGNHCWNFMNNSNWLKSSYKLTQFNHYQFPVRFKFSFNSSATTNNITKGWAIDNFSITLPPAKSDAGVMSIAEPASYTPSGTLVQVKVQVSNFGKDTLYAIPVAYQVDNSSTVSETYTGKLLPDSSVSYTFNSKFTAKYAYNLCAFTQLANDGNRSNDKICFYSFKDVGVYWIEKPLSDALIDTDTKVTVTIKNYGISEIDSTDITYTIDGVPQSKETWKGKLLPDELASYTFIKSLQFKVGAFNLCAYTTLQFDANAANNKSCKSIDIINSISQFSILHSQFSILNLYPNPCSDYTIIKYYLPEPSDVRVDVYNIYGIRVNSEKEKTIAGTNYLRLTTYYLRQGIYYYTLSYKGQRLTGSLIKMNK